jgi:hypothetical protein
MTKEYALTTGQKIAKRVLDLDICICPPDTRITVYADNRGGHQML